MKENKLKSVASALAYQRTVGVDIRISDLENKIADIKANCDLAIEGRDIKIMELEHKLEQTEKDLTDYQFNYPTIKELEKENKEAKGLLNEMRIALRQTKDGAKYNVSLLEDVDKLLKEIEKWKSQEK